MQKIIIGREFPKEATKLIKSAKHNIKILIYDWRWYPTEIASRIQQFNNSVVHASNTGVSVSAYSDKISYMGFAPKVSCSFTFNGSNIAFFDYQATDCQIGFTQRF